MCKISTKYENIIKVWETRGKRGMGDLKNLKKTCFFLKVCCGHQELGLPELDAFEESLKPDDHAGIVNNFIQMLGQNKLSHRC